jgi:hypothetical protein
VSPIKAMSIIYSTVSMSLKRIIPNYEDAGEVIFQKREPRFFNFLFEIFTEYDENDI